MHPLVLCVGHDGVRSLRVWRARHRALTRSNHRTKSRAARTLLVRVESERGRHTEAKADRLLLISEQRIARHALELVHRWRGGRW